jgi:hypothetical protein
VVDGAAGTDVVVGGTVVVVSGSDVVVVSGGSVVSPVSPEQPAKSSVAVKRAVTNSLDLDLLLVLIVLVERRSVRYAIPDVGDLHHCHR